MRYGIVQVDRRCKGGKRLCASQKRNSNGKAATSRRTPWGRGDHRLVTADATTMAGVGRTRGSASLPWQALRMLNPSNEANFSGGLDLWKDRNVNWLGCTELRKSNWLRLSEIGFVWGSGAIREAVWGEKDVRWTREKEILRNEPKFIQAGVEKWRERSQKRTQVWGSDREHDDGDLSVDGVCGVGRPSHNRGTHPKGCGYIRVRQGYSGHAAGERVALTWGFGGDG